LKSSESSKAFICLLTALWVTPSCWAAPVTLRQLPTIENARSEVRLGEFFEVMMRGLLNDNAMHFSPFSHKGHYKNEWMFLMIICLNLWF
jgi:hypothetical protein